MLSFSIFNIYYLMQTLLPFLIIATTSSNEVCLTPIVQQNSLCQLYNATNGQGWKWTSSLGNKWVCTYNSTTSMDACRDRWQGVACMNMNITTSDHYGNGIVCIHVVKKLNVNAMNLQGSLPDDLDLGYLTSFKCGFNKLVGNLPSFKSLSKLSVLHYHANKFTGNIPTIYQQWASIMTDFNVYDNYINGSIPDFIGNFTKLKLLRLKSNLLSGTIPSSLGNCQSLTLIGMYHNKLTGPIPSSLGKLKELSELRLFNNSFTGTIPSELSSLSSLLRLEANVNRLTGTIPSSIGTLKKLQYLLLYENSLHGRIPPTLNNLNNMIELWLYKNKLTGAIPDLSSCRSLESFRVQSNYLCGSLNNVFKTENQRYLWSIDISDNILESTIPANLFLLPSLKLFAATKNCFTGSLPETICNAVNMNLLSLDGLSTSNRCHRQTFLGVFVHATFGSVPSCIWTFQYLEFLHLSSNAFSGTLPRDIFENNNVIKYINIARNRFTSTIPEVLTSGKFLLEELDLSHNKLYGVVHNKVSYCNNSIAASEIGGGCNANSSLSLSLKVNRLTGELANNVFQSATSSISVLDGNMFQCKSYDSLPEKDQKRDNYFCGSLNLDFPFLLWIVSLGAFIIILAFCLSYPSDNLRIITTDFMRYFSYINEITAIGSKEYNPNHLANTIAFLNTFKCLVYWGATIGISTLVIEIIAYSSLKLSRSYSSHLQQYHWATSGAYLSGNIPAVVIFFIWMFLIISVVLTIRINNSKQWVTLDKSVRDRISKAVSLKKNWLIFGALLFDMVVMILVNIGYILLISECKRFIFIIVQLSLSVFKIISNCIFIPLYTTKIASIGGLDRLQRVLLRTSMLIFNTFFAPLFSTIFTESACFRELLYPTTDIDTEYNFNSCEVLNVTSHLCQTYSIERSITSFTPPIMYNNQCRNSFLNAYIPVLLYNYIFLGLFSPLIYLILSNLSYERIPLFVIKIYGSILWPHSTLSASLHTSSSRYSSTLISSLSLFDAEDIMTTQNVHISVLLTFGVFSPILMAAVLLAMAMDYIVWRLLIGRFIYAHDSSYRERVTKASVSIKVRDETDILEEVKEEVVTPIDDKPVPIYTTHEQLTQSSASKLVSKLELCCKDAWRCPNNSIWLIIISSAVFIILILIDMVVDDAPIEDSVWPPVLLLGMPILLWVVLKTYRNKLFLMWKSIKKRDEHDRNTFWGKQDEINCRVSSRNISLVQFFFSTKVFGSTGANKSADISNSTEQKSKIVDTITTINANVNMPESISANEADIALPASVKLYAVTENPLVGSNLCV